jgi:hypothetical protein
MTTKYTKVAAALAASLAALPAFSANKFIGATAATGDDVSIILDIKNGVDVDNNGTIDATVDGNPAYDSDGLVNGEILWDAANTWILNELVFITNGTLRIEAGTIIRGQPRSAVVPPATTAPFNPGALAIARTAKIIADGTREAPIVFTTASTTGATSGGRYEGTGAFWDTVTTPRNPTVAGSWGGLIVLGNAPTAVDRNLSAADAGLASVDANRIYFSEETPGLLPSKDDRSNIEGVPSTTDAFETGADRFGGNYPSDNSGIIRYVSIRHGGANLASNSEINGLTMGGVGSDTIVENVEIWGNTDDGVEIFGGTVNVKNALVVASQDDSLDLDAGYTGTIQFFCAIGANNMDEFAEWDGTYEEETVNGFTNAGSVPATLGPIPTYRVFNATFIRPTGVSTGNASINIDDQAAPYFANSIVVNARTRHLRISSRGTENFTDTIQRFERGQAVIRSVTFFGSPTVNVSSQGPGTGSNVNALAVSDNRILDIIGLFSGVPAGSVGDASAYSFDNLVGNTASENPGISITGTAGDLVGVVIDPRPTEVGGFDPLAPVSGPILTSVAYRGAFTDSLDALWTTGWTAANEFGLLVD